MIRSVRKFITILATVCFISMATGVTLQLHLLGREHSQEHNSEQCSICQQLMASGRYIAEQESQFDEIAQLKYFFDTYSRSFITVFNLKSFKPRPPPQIF